MGNCQAVDLAALVIQHPNGKLERMYWPIPASDVMKMNTGHYVTPIIPLPIPGDRVDDRAVWFTRVKLLRPIDTLVLGRAYRLVTTQEVMKLLRARKYGNMRTEVMESEGNLQKKSSCSFEKTNQIQSMRADQRHQQRSRSMNITSAGRLNSWRPSLRSIAES